MKEMFAHDDFQEKLDLSHDDLDAGDIPDEDYNAMKDNLKSSMPDAVRACIPGMEETPDPQMEPTADDLEISLDMVPGVAAPGLGS